MADDGSLAPLTMGVAEARELLATQIRKGQELLQREVNDAAELEELRAEFRKWNDYNADLLRKLFGGDSVSRWFRRGRGTRQMLPRYATLADHVRPVLLDIKHFITELESISQRIELRAAPVDARPSPTDAIAGSSVVSQTPPSGQHFPVFVGSTYEDLKPYRAAVREALVRMEHIVQGMEYFGSKPGSPKEECLKVVRSCRVYVGIFAMRYGSVDEETGKSMTHLEYDEAQRLELPTLIYLLDEENQPVLAGHVDTGENAEKLRDLKGELKQRFTVSFFTTPKDLARRVSQDLPPVLAELGVELDEAEGGLSAMEQPSASPVPLGPYSEPHVTWEQLGRPTSPVENLVVPGIGRMDVEQRHIDKAAEHGGKVAFELIDVGTLQDDEPTYALGRAVRLSP